MHSFWIPEASFVDTSDIYIIGGGSSLQGFNWDRLIGRRVIGCNSAFTLGASICPMCIFSDLQWFDKFVGDLIRYAGMLVACNERVAAFNQTNWIKVMRRHRKGLHKDGLGFGGNTGCAAINLALLLGARRVFLLGFDCDYKQARNPSWKSNWHNRIIQDSFDPELFDKYTEGFTAIANDLPWVFPEAKIINLNPQSGLRMFQFADVDEILNAHATNTCN